MGRVRQACLIAINASDAMQGMNGVVEGAHGRLSVGEDPTQKADSPL